MPYTFIAGSILTYDCTIFPLPVYLWVDMYLCMYLFAVINNVTLDIHVYFSANIGFCFARTVPCKGYNYWSYDKYILFFGSLHSWQLYELWFLHVLFHGSQYLSFWLNHLSKYFYFSWWLFVAGNEKYMK